MCKIGIFYGSDTGNTESVAKKIQKCFPLNSTKIYDITSCNKNDLEQFQILILGVPTWYYGEMQSDWEDFIPIFEKINFKNKIFALFGCGDQEDYSEYFCDALGILYKILANKKVKIIGKWPNDDYYFDESKALLDKKNFCGLIIDEDRQTEKTQSRIEKWVKQLITEINSIVKILE